LHVVRHLLGAFSIGGDEEQGVGAFAAQGGEYIGKRRPCQPANRDCLFAFFKAFAQSYEFFIPLKPLYLK